MLSAIEHGAPGDLILIHGAGGNNLLWKRTLGYLSGPGIARAVNLPGHPDGAITCHTVREYSQCVREFIKDCELPKPVVCGHSMGGAVALTLAAEHPEGVGGLVLVDTGAKLGVDPKIVAGLEGQPMKAIEQLITPMSFHKVDLQTGREARSALSVSNLPVFLNDYLACDGFDVRNSLSRISAKTLIVCGESDRMTPPRWSHYLSARIPSSSLYFIREAGHMVPLEKPELLASLIQWFLGSLSR